MQALDQATAELRTPAWIYGTWTSHPGALELRDGRLSFIPAEEDGHGFCVELAELENVNFPSWARDTNLKLKIAGKKYRITFIQPRNAAPVGAHLADVVGMDLAGEYVGAAATANALSTYPAGFKSGKAWSALLEVQPE